MTNKEKRLKTQQLLLANPSRSDRDIARELGISANMVGRVRLEGEMHRKIPVVVKRRGRDGKERKKRRTDDEIRNAKSEVPPRHGRPASPGTSLIRAMLDDTDGKITFQEALPMLETLGHAVSQNTFNVTKNRWKKSRRGK